MNRAEPLSLATEALTRLDQPGCACCRAGLAGERREIGAFVTEHYNHPAVVPRLRHSLGFCPAHTRLLLTRQEAGFVLPTVYREIVDAALAGLERGRTGSPGQGCLICEAHDGAADRAGWFIARGLTDQRVVRAFAESGGLCLPHALRVLPESGGTAAAIVVSSLVGRVEPAVAPPALELVAGEDRDRLRRAALRQGVAALAAELPHAARIEEQLLALLRVKCCPVCLRASLVEERYLGWLAEEIGRRPDLVLVDGTRLCPGHLHDLHLGDQRAGTWMTERAAGVAHWQLRRAASQVQAIASPWRDRWARVKRVGSHGHGTPASLTELLGSPRARWRESLRAVARVFNCAACSAMRGAEAAIMELLSAALGDAGLRQAFDRSQGLCLRHLHLAPVGLAEPARELCRTRLDLMLWELLEAARTSGWSERHALRGEEVTSWTRAPILLDGRVYLGGPYREQYRALSTAPLLDAGTSVR